MENLSSTTIDIFLSNENEEIMSLRYQLFDNDFMPRWLGLVKESLNIPENKIVDDGHFFGMNFNKEEALEKKLNDAIDYINNHFRSIKREDSLIKIRAQRPMSVEFLNELHLIFEKYEPDHTLNTNDEIRKVLTDMNVNIHKAEQFAHKGLSIDHIQVLFQKETKERLRLSDYKYFNLDYKFGYLYLTYGMTGVPTRDAFLHKTVPTPQSLYTPGMYLCFFGDLIFRDFEPLMSWMREQGMEPTDPVNALGYIPLGKLLEPEISNRKEFMEKISQFNKVVRVHIGSLKENGKKRLDHFSESQVTKKWEEVNYAEKTEDTINGRTSFLNVPNIPAPLNQENLAPARWPEDQEILYHLDYCPYIDLKVSFDAKKILAEAQRALSYFVVHRDYDQESNDEKAKWRSLGLRSLFGDHTKTQYHTSYNFDGPAIYKQTIFSLLCPETVKFLNTITDFEKCERVRFMLLEPGASIKVHRDHHQSDTCLAVNISLNMPKGCVFYAGLNSDGTKNDYSVELPFEDSGTVLLFNNAKYHTVTNQSDVPRIHIIFHGPIRFSDKRLLDLARAQNQIFFKKDLLKELVKKKLMTGESLEKTALLKNDWKISGLVSDSLPDNIDLVVFDHSYFQSKEKESSLDLITKASLFPLSYRIIKEGDFDTALLEAKKNQKQFVVFVAAGTLITDINNFLVELMSYCSRMKDENIVVSGQIIDDINSKFLPYFHEQFLIINIERWYKYAGLKLGNLFSHEEIVFPSYERSQEHIHDDYTPLWISSGEQIKGRKGLCAWGSEAIAKLVKSKVRVENVPQTIRENKMYAYPRDNNQMGWEGVKTKILDKLNYSKNEVYVFNNEPLKIEDFNNFQPDCFISVAAGLKPFKIMNQYGMSEKTKCHFVDFSQNSINYYNALKNVESMDNLVKVTTVYSLDKFGQESQNICQKHLQGIIRDEFDGVEQKLIDSIKNIKKSTTEVGNLIESNNLLPSLINSNDKFLIWVSNAFYNNSLYYLMNQDQCRNAYLETAKKIKEKSKTNAFLQKGSWTIVFGESPTQIKGILTDGGLNLHLNGQSEWEEIK